ncbi:MAG: phosphoribosylformylglycinamidine synthase subunit PurL, partial [Coriobacteriia bacterium]|nr:phosphoribosylformylglycinamidine synthase subunit PurL [Coriobacteriia bacterium]
EKLLIEACLELLDGKLLVALGDLGAAGLTSSASEMASRGGVGLEIDVAKVPQREDAMQPFEIMVSESQERMLAVVTPENLDAARAICEKWGLLSTVIGRVTDTGRFVVTEGEKIVADMPASTLADDAPIYDPPKVRPAYLDKVQAFDPHSVMHPESVAELTETLLRVLSSPNVCSRRWIWEQYDHQVMVNSVVLPGSDAAVLRIGDTGRGEMTDRAIAVSSDCNGRYCYLDPYLGAQIALAEAARNVACSGGEPAAITDCLNFGSPEKPEVFWTFFEAIRGISDACKAWEIPVISGNVSFYNESFGQPIYPTPTVGLVGLLDHVDQHCTMAFKSEGDVVVLVGETHDELGGSELLKVVHDIVAGRPPALDLDLESDVQDAVRDAIRADLARSAHDCSEGGIAVALAESCIAGDIGCDVHLDDEMPAVSSLFSESQSRIVLTVAARDVEALLGILKERLVPYAVIGKVGGSRLHIREKVDVDVDTLRLAWEPTLERLVRGEIQSEELYEG